MQGKGNRREEGELMKKNERDRRNQTEAPKREWSSRDYEDKFDMMENGTFFDEEEEAYAEAEAFEEEAFQNRYATVASEPEKKVYQSEAERFAASVDPDYVDPGFRTEDPDYGGGVYAPLHVKPEEAVQSSHEEKELQIMDFDDSMGEERRLKTEFAEDYTNQFTGDYTNRFTDDQFRGEIIYQEPENDTQNTYADGQYAEQGAYADGQYAEQGAYADDQYAEQGAYADDQYAAQGAYADDQYAEQGAYAEQGTYEDAQYADENGYVEDEQYAGDVQYADAEGENWEEEAEAEYAEYDDSEEFNEDDEAGLSFAHKLKKKIASMGALDWVILSTGLAVTVLLLVVGIVTFGGRATDTSKETAALANIGQNMDGIGIIGENGMNQVTDVTIERLTAAKNETLENLVAEAGSEKMAIMLNVTTLDHDLKIKFVNAETNKMVAGYEFMAEVTFPSGTSEVYTDTDKDGMIHVNKLSAGTYSCKIVENPDIDPNLFVWSSLLVSTSVKDTMDYVKVDVSDEIKTVDEIVEAVEDVEEQEEATPVESVLQDTVEWVESTKTSTGSNVSYKEIKLEDIKNPAVASANKVFYKTAQQTPGEGEGEGKTAETPNPENPGGENPGGENQGGENQGGENNTPPAPEKLLEGKTVTVSGVSEAEKDKEYTFSLTGVPAGDFTYAWSADNATIVDGDKAQCKIKFTGASSVKCTITNKNNGEDKLTTAAFGVTIKAPAIVATTEKAADLSVAVGSTATFKNTTTISETAIRWEAKSSDASIATVTAQDGVATVTGVKAGTANIELICKNTEGVLLHTVTCTVTVTGEISASIDSEKLSVVSGKTADLTITIANLPKDATWTVTWASDKTTVATVAEKASSEATKKMATVTGVDKLTASSEATVTATVTVTANNKQIFTKGFTCKVTVTPGAAADTTSILYTNKGEVVYVMKDGQYVTAVYADYYVAGQKFYTKSEKSEYKYTGWQTIDGNTYYFNKNGDKVTGDQVIMGAQYHFASDGALITGSGSLGIDVSKWNNNINWSAVSSSGVSFVIIRCGYRGASTGVLVEDPKFKSNIKGATGAGLKVGVYFFSQATTEGEAVEEASMCLSLISGYRISYPIFIDLESASNGRANNISSDERTKVAMAFCKTITNAGYKAGVYANKTWLTSKMNASSLGSYNIWLAQYAAQPSYKGKYNLWQYTSKGKINGVPTDVDLDISYLGY